MRSTRASAAVERLKSRSGNQDYSMVRTADGLFYLVSMAGAGAPERLCEALDMDDFVAFVNGLGPQKVRKQSKLDVAFEKQLVRKKSP
jgi:hypothetical protein